MRSFHSLSGVKETEKTALLLRRFGLEDSATQWLSRWLPFTVERAILAVEGFTKFQMDHKVIDAAFQPANNSTFVQPVLARVLRRNAIARNANVKTDGFRRNGRELKRAVLLHGHVTIIPGVVSADVDAGLR